MFSWFQRLLENLKISDDRENADNLIDMEKIVPLLQRLIDLYVTTATSTTLSVCNRYCTLLKPYHIPKC